MGVLSCISSYSQGVLNVFQEWTTTTGTQNLFYKNVTQIDPNTSEIYVAGATMNGSGNYDILVSKFASNGAYIWSQQVNGYANQGDFATALVVTDSGNVVVTGAITDTAFASDMFTMKLDGTTGSITWIKTFDAGGNFQDLGTALAVGDSGCVFVTGGGTNGSLDMDVITLKYTSTGTMRWSTLYDYNGGNDGAVNMFFAKAPHMYVTGPGERSTGSSSYDGLSLKFNMNSGSIVASFSTGSLPHVMDIVNDAIKDDLGNIYIVGGVTTVSNGYDTYVIALDSNLAYQWDASYDGASGLDDVGTGVTIDTLSDKVYISGYSTITGEGKNLIAIGYDNTGSQIYFADYNDTLNGDDEGIAIEIDNDGDLIVAGYDSTSLNNRDYYTIKYDNTLTEIWSIRADGNAHLDDRITNIAIDTLGDVVVTGESRKLDGSLEYKTVKYLEHDVVTPTDFNSENPSSTFLYYQNCGQLIDTSGAAVPGILYYTTNSFPNYYIKDKSMSMVFEHIDSSAATPDTLHRVDVAFDQVNTNAKSYLMEESPEYLNYYLAHCPQGITEVHGHKRILTTDIYSNIDLEYYSNRYGLKCYFIVKPGGDPTDIKLTFTGASSFSLNGTTNALSIISSVGSLIFDRPTVYQLNSSNVVVPITGWTADWQTNGASNKYKFNISTYDSTKVLIIEIDLGNAAHAAATTIGNLEHSTYYGSTVWDMKYDVQTDGAGSVYTCGETKSNFFPTASGLYTSLKGTSDATLVKFDNSMIRKWATYYGGTGDETGYSLAVGSGGVHLVGTTTSATGATSAIPIPTPLTGALNDNSYAGSTDNFIAKINPLGFPLMWATYLGGSGYEIPYKVRVDGMNNFYLVGQGTTASPIKSKTGAYNQSATGLGYLAKFNSADTLVWSTLFPGSNYIADFCANGSGENCLLLHCTSTGLPIVQPAPSSYKDSVVTGASDIGIVKLNSSDNIYWSTYYGGSGLDRPGGIAFDSYTSLYMGGNTGSSDFPFYFPGGLAYCDSSLGAGGDAVVAKFDKQGVRKWASYYGGVLQTDMVTAVTCDDDDNVFFTGQTACTDFPLDTLTGAFQEGPTGITSSTPDGFLICFDKYQARVWSTYFGGGGYDTPWGIATDHSSYLYLVGRTESPNSNWPLADLGGGAWYRDTLNNGTNSIAYPDGYIARFDLTPVIVLGVTENGQQGNTSMIVYPNPGSGNATLQITLDKPTDLTIFVYSTLGQVVCSKQLKNQNGVVKENIDIADMATGVYFISVQTDREKLSTKLIKK